MESFFGRLKTAIMDRVARCRTFDDAKELISGYIKVYNTEHYQYDLAALTPAEFYQYATTGIYPLDNYFGVPASVMMTNGDLKKVRRRYADDEAKKRRETAARKREGKRLIDPLRIINRDQKLLDRFIRKWEESKETATTQIAHLREIVEKVRKALDFIAALPSEKYEELKDPLIWRNYEQLGYVFEMNELF
jgi:hypothetical protein